MNVYLAIFISTMLMFFSCNNHTGIESSEGIGHKTYEMAVSSNGEHRIYSYINPKTGLMEVSTGDTPYDETIYYNLDINNSGDYAFCAYSQSNSVGSVFLNGEKVYSDGLYNDVVLSDSYLFVNYERLYDDTSFLYVYNIFSGAVQKIKLPYYLRNPLKTTTGIYYEAFEKNTARIGIVFFNFKNFSFSEYSFNERAYIIGDKIIKVNARDSDSAIFVNAVVDYVNHDPNLALGTWNNHLGRLSWHLAYRMKELLEFRRLTGLNHFDRTIGLLADNLLNRYSEDRWCTTKYSIDGKQQLFLMVDCGMILNSLLEAANEGVLSVAQIDVVRRILSYEMQYYEQDWIAYSETISPYIDMRGGGGYYKFRKGIPYTYDGIVQPFNQQNVWMNVCMEGYFLTGDEFYKNRAFQLMQNFASEFVWEGEKLIWHYWPQIFYNGWTADAAVSKNTPQKDKTVDILFEDLSHAGLNVYSIYKFLQFDMDSKILPRTVFVGLNETLTEIMKTRYNRFIKISEDSRYESFEYFPHGYWSLLDNELLHEVLEKTIPSSFIYNEFDSVSPLSYLLGIRSLDAFNITLTIEKGEVGKRTISFTSPADFVSYMLTMIN